MSEPIVIAFIGACFSALAATLSAVTLAYLSSIDHRVSALESKAMHRS